MNELTNDTPRIISKQKIYKRLTFMKTHIIIPVI